MGVLQNRNFAFLWIGRLISSYGDNLYALALPWYVYALTSSKPDLTVVGFADYMPAIAGFFVGALVDRWHKRTVMLTSDVVRTFLALGIFLVVLVHAPFGLVFAAALAIQFVGAFFSPASGALTPLLVSSEELPQAMGLLQSGSGIVELVGMASGGALMAFIKASGLFFIDSISFLGSIISVLLITVKEDVVTKAERPSLVSEWKEGLAIMFRSKTVLQVFSGGLITNFGLSSMGILLTAWIKGPVHGSSTTYGVLLGCLVLGTIVGGLTLGKVAKVLAPKAILRTGLLLLGCCTALIGVWSNDIWCGCLLFIAGFCISSLNGALEVLLVKVVPQDMRGRLFGMFNGIMVMASPLGLAVFGTLLIVLPMWIVWMIVGCLSVLGGLAYFVRVPDDLDQLFTSISSS